jgi:MarR family transcriptional regulator, organic hydroperoxide resistance regulator
MEPITHGGFYISQIKQIQDRIFEKLLKENGIEDFNGPQGRILFVLWQQDNLSIRELSRGTSLAKTTLTSMLDRMERGGSIQRLPDPVDRRQTRILLTPKARASTGRYLEVSRQMADIFYRGFSVQAIHDLDETLALILNNLKEHEASHGTGNQGSNRGFGG